MKHHEVTEHLASCKACQRVAGRLSLALEIAVQAHVDARREHGSAPRNARRADAPVT